MLMVTRCGFNQSDVSAPDKSYGAQPPAESGQDLVPILFSYFYFICFGRDPEMN